MSQAVVAPEPEQGAGELELAQVVAGLPVATDQDAAALRQPGDRALHDLSARETLLALDKDSLVERVLALHERVRRSRRTWCGSMNTCA